MSIDAEGFFLQKFNAETLLLGRRAFDAQRVAFNAVHFLHDIGVT